MQKLIFIFLFSYSIYSFADYKDCAQKIIKEYKKPLSKDDRQMITGRVKNECKKERKLTDIEQQCRAYQLENKKNLPPEDMKGGIILCKKLPIKLADQPFGEETCLTKVCQSAEKKEICSSDYLNHGGAGLEYCFKWIAFKLCIIKHEVLNNQHPDFIEWKVGNSGGKTSCKKF